MAEVKKKAVKKTVKKKTVKKVESKATSKASTSKKVVEKKSKVKAPTKKLKSKKTEKNWKSISISLGIIGTILISIAVYFLLISGNTENNSNNSLEISQNSSIITLIVIEDPNCLNCQVDLFIEQVKTNLIPNLEVQKISIETTQGKSLISKLNLKEAPTYLFSNSITNRSDWNTQLKEAFILVNIDSVDFYMLNPQIIPSKVMIENLQILDNAIVYGDVNAPVTIFEFSDFECPFCAIAEGNLELVNQFKVQNPTYEPAMPKVFEQYIKTGKVKLVFYNMPLEELHPNVKPTHLAAICANEQGKWYEFKTKLFENRNDWIGSDINLKMKSYAVELGLDSTSFDSCLDSKKYDSQITNEINYAVSLGISGTPAFFIDKDFLSGAQDFNTFQTIIESKLAALN